MQASAGAAAPRADEVESVWPVGPAKPTLSPGEVHVWRADLAALGACGEELLSAEERERGSRILGERRRIVWQRSRRVLRELLGRYLAIAPSAVELHSGAHGKPELVGALRPGAGGRDPAPLAFNLSHSGDLALYAFAGGGAVGVDLELARPGRARDHIALARRALGEEAAAGLERLPAREREGEFLRLWTGHEAVLKCQGTGLGPAASDREGDPWLAHLELGPGAAAAVACSRAPCELRLWSWADGGGASRA